MGAMMGVGVLALPLVLLFGVFWIWMLIDLLQRRKFEDKLVWVLVMIFLFILGAVLYYFLVYSKGRK
ncbi:MAG: PLDc N-terminal domain-containing protein [Candidatus Aenigmarchaeota archaeon]|nr:PLDc N-terminal domain-containing protein [Candidatus Aenigmarchaeota archaeon]